MLRNELNHMLIVIIYSFNNQMLTLYSYFLNDLLLELLIKY